VTVIVGVRCADGVILATDSQGTSHFPGNIPVKLVSKKIEHLGKHLVYGGTGGVGAGQRMHAALIPHAAKMGIGRTATDIADTIRGLVNPAPQQIRSEWVQLPNTSPEEWGAIFCGWAKDRPWILEIAPSGITQFHDPFAAMGSGHPFAHTVLLSVS
jgi:proteasome beta subunit